MFGYVLIAVVILVAVLALVIASRPERFSVERSISVAAPPDAVFAQVNDLHNWEHWSPWATRDPGMIKVYEGPPAGVGAVYRWNGNKAVGEGSNTLVESRPGELIRMQLEFQRPFQASNEVQFRFVPEGSDTRVSWNMTGRNTFISKAMHLVMDMDKLCGGDFERGLAQLKAITEALGAGQLSHAQQAARQV
ncbi:MAG: SRPBCC family protein [Pseudomonadota bacterium]